MKLPINLKFSMLETKKYFSIKKPFALDSKGFKQCTQIALGILFCLPEEQILIQVFQSSRKFWLISKPRKFWY